MVSIENDAIGLWVIEDDPMFRNGMEELINDTSGMRCERVFETCEEALQVIKDEGAPQIVLVDIGLPGMSGIDGIRKMKSLSPDHGVHRPYHLRESSEGVRGDLCRGHRLSCQELDP